jgi:electron transport complex protein RnfD
MLEQKLYVGSHAPYGHNGSSITEKSYHIMLAALPAVIMGIYHYGVPALRVVAFSVSSAMIWEYLLNRVMRRPVSIGDGNAALIGLLLGMLLPATTPWYAVIAGTFVAMVVGKHMFGGIGCNPLNPALVAVAILILSWGELMDFDDALRDVELGFAMTYPLTVMKYFGPEKASEYGIWKMFLGQQSGAVGAAFGLGLVLGGVYLMFRGFIRWEISVSFLAGLFLTAFFFQLGDPSKYGGPLFHLVTGYTLIGAFFLATEDSSSPVNTIPMVIYGLGCGALTVLIRNVGFFVDGAVFAILLMNIANPLLDKIRPRSLGKGVEHA